MSFAIAFSTSPAYSTGGRLAPQPRGLDADLAKAQSELADWVHCPSSKTPEGKAKIEEVSAKVDAIKGQMKKAEEGPQIVAQPAARTEQTHRSQADASDPSQASSAAGSAPTAAARPLVFSGLGSYLNVYA